MTQEEATMMDDVIENLNWITVAGKIRRYKAIINIKHLSEGSINNKIHTVNQALAGNEHFMGAKLHFYNKEQFIMAEFGCKEAMESACNLQLEKENDHKLEGLHNRGDQEIKEKTLIMRDLPLNANKDIIKGILEQRTGCTILDIKNKISGPWITSHVTFENKTAVEKLKDTWSMNYLKDLCKIAPANYTKEDFDNRNQYTLKLTELPFGITAYNLRELLFKVQAKTCFIPCTKNKYTRARYAYVTFENEEALNKALEGDQFKIKNQQLKWVTDGTTTCHKCGSPDHIVKDCGERMKVSKEKQNSGI